ncbi:plasmid mobilization protein [Helicobacter cetorum]|uniref:Mobilization protein n=1 Tax=Helicobacter cetorum (strain ATCC BAA-540 / CCUG 52418 / MIT 99-5656) TaxID=1163745 RepID=I0EUV3_HELCM|nr:plasmid mobilization relaxosome protein MobC [Helicobacter cetorum]AFI06722.1 mobilization protein [Helicobacter cetorum MIT 99-5656]
MKTTAISIRLNKEQKDLITFKAKAINISKTDLILRAIENAEIKSDSKDTTKLLSEVNRIGNNLNQIAHAINLTKLKNQLHNFDFSTLENDLTIIKYQLNELLKKA